MVGDDRIYKLYRWHVLTCVIDTGGGYGITAALGGRLAKMSDPQIKSPTTSGKQRSETWSSRNSRTGGDADSRTQIQSIFDRYHHIVSNGDIREAPDDEMLSFARTQLPFQLQLLLRRSRTPT
jgi:hypothetical protein